MFSVQRIAAVGLVLCALSGCDAHEQQDAFAEEASRPPENITRVSESGEVLEVDEDDWRTAPLYRGEILVDPAEPNPVATGGFVAIRVSVTVFNAVQAPLRVETLRDNRLRTLDVIDQASDPGAYVFSFPASEIGSRGLHRIFVFDGVGELVSYGDVMVE
ncbi:MAG: hypothetical protein WD423_02175 [Rhodothermales bacterium]